MDNSKRPTILYVEDDEALSFVTKDHLELKGYDVTHCMDGLDALSAFHSGTFDLCLFDIMLPKMDGFELAHAIRKVDRAVPVLFLTAKSMKEDRLQGFELGGDDYITKPFSIEELIMKIEVFLKRRQISGAGVNKAKEINIGKYQLDLRNLQLSIGDDVRQLTQRESDILKYFADRPNDLIERGQILEAIWGENDYFLGRSLDVFISKLRRYLKADPSIKIQNVHGVGFRLILD
jgi:DNA-binding response OmpR family regulator